MKIVFLSFYSGYVYRGMETVVFELSSRWSLDHQVSVFQSKPLNIKVNYNTQIIKLSSMSWPKVSNTSLLRKFMLDYYYRKIALFTLKSLEMLKDDPPDIIIPANGGWQSYFCKKFSQKYKSKLVIMGQSGIGWDDKWNIRMKPDLFVALSDRNYRWSQKYANKRQKIIKISNGVNIKKFSPIKNAKTKSTLREKIFSQFNLNNFNIKKPIILCVAGHEKSKRVSQTIKAVSKLNEAQLLVLGGSDITKKLGLKILGNRFAQLRVRYDQIPNLYRICDVFTLVSESSEAFGLVYIEAMATGLPIVATDDELRKEIIGEQGLYIKDPNNFTHYSKLLIKAINLNVSETMRLRSKNYDWDIISNIYINQFKNIL